MLLNNLISSRFFLYNKLLFSSLYALKQVVFAFLFVFLSFYSLQGQVAISYPSNAQVLERGMGNSFLEVRIRFSTTCTANSVEIRLPNQVEYISGSLSKNGGSLNIAEQNISNLRKPVFSISNSSSNSFINFVIRRKALCASPSIGKDSIYVSSSCGNVTENASTVNTYSIREPVLSFINFQAINNALLGRTYNRKFEIVNGGQGCLDTLRFYVVNRSNYVTYTRKLRFNNDSFAPFLVKGDTSFYKIFGLTIFNGQRTMCNGSKVVVEEQFTVNKCSGGLLMYSASWGQNEQNQCKRIFVNGNIVMATGVGSFNGISMALDTGYKDMCGTGKNGMIDMVATYWWRGQGNDTAAGAYNISLRVGNNSGSNLLASLPTNMIDFIGLVSINGDTIASSYNAGILTISLSNRFTTDIDGPGGLTDLDKDGFFDDLALNSTITFKFKIKLKCTQACNFTKNLVLAGDLGYNLMCDTSYKYSLRLGSGRNLREATWIGNGYIPANISSGQAFRVRLSNGASWNENFLRTSATRFQWRIVLPKGFSLASNVDARWTSGFYFNNNPSAPITYIKSGDTLIFNSPNNIPGSVEFNLVYNCDNFYTEIFTLNYTLVQINNPSTGCMCMHQMVCASLQTKVYCPSGCSVGPINGIPTIRRTPLSLGWKNDSMTQRQTVNNISAYDLSKALYLDTIEISSYAIQQDSTNSLRLRFELNKSAGNISKLQPLYMVFECYRKDSLIRKTIDSAYTQGFSTNTIQRIDWDMSQLLPQGALLSKDSVVTKTYYVVITNTLPNFDVQSGSEWYYYNVNSMNSSMDFCNKRIPEMYLVGTSLLNASNIHNTTGCNTIGLGGFTNYLGRRFASSGTPFHTEYRPVFKLDSIVLKMPSGYTFDSANYYSLAAYNSPAYSIFNVKPDRIVGNNYTFYNKGQWGPASLSISNSYGAYFQVVATPTCSTLPAEEIETFIYAKDYFYKFGLDSIYPSGFVGDILNAKRQINHVNKGSIRLVNNSLNKLATQNKENLSLRIINNSQASTPFVWGKITGNNNIKVDSVFLVSPRQKLDLIQLDSLNSWFKISQAGLLSGQFLDLDLFTNFNACNSDSIKVQIGWNCQDFPTSPANAVCGLDSIFLKLVPDNSEIQLAFLPFKKSKFTICSMDTFVLDFNNANAAYVYSPYVEFEVAGGIDIPDSVFLEYPASSGLFYKTKAVVFNGKARIDLDAIPSIKQDGIPGLKNTTNTAQRNVRVHVPFSINCSFVSGLSLVANAFAKSPCGENVIGNGFTAISSALDLNGIVFSGDIKLEVLPSKKVVQCGDEFKIQTKITPYFEKFGTGDTMVLRVNKVLNLSDSFFTKNRNCDSCKYVIEKDLNNNWLVKVVMDTSVVVDSISVFEINFKQNFTDTGSFIVDAYFKRNVAPLLCKTVYCENSSVVLKRFSSDSIHVRRPPIKADFSIFKSDSCERTNQINLLNTSSITSSIAFASNWTFTDQTKDTSTSVLAKTFPGFGTQTIKLLTIAANSCKDSVTKNFYLYPNPSAAFSLNDSTQCLRGNLFVASNFSQMLDSSSLKYKWIVQDSVYNDSAEIKHRFFEDGIFDFILVAESLKGCTDTASIPVKINPMPIAQFSISDTAMCLLGNSFSLVNQSTIKSNQTLRAIWNFDNLDTSHVYSTSYAFSSFGKKSITLQVFSPDNCADTIQKMVEVYPMPKSSFVLSDTGLCFLGNQFDFEQRASIADNSPLFYNWDFGNGLQDTASIVQHSYTGFGKFTVQCIALSKWNCADTSKAQIEVFPMPKAAFDISDSILCFRGNEFVFTQKSSISGNDSLSYFWDFGDSVSSIVHSPSYSYSNVGKFSVRLEAVSPYQCKDTFYTEVETKPMPEAKISALDSSLCFKNNVFYFQEFSSVQDSSILGNPYWDFGNGETSNLYAPTFSYNAPGKYKVSFAIQTPFSCADTASIEVEVFSMPQSDFLRSDTAMCLLGNNFNFKNTSNISSSDSLAYIWTIDSMAIAISKDLDYSFLTHGNYTIGLQALSSNLCADTLVQRVEIHPMPSASFAVIDSAQCLEANVFQFANQSSIVYGELYFLWDFKDSTFSTDTNPVHSYSKFGKYSTTLIVNSKYNCADTFAKKLEVFPMPNASFIVEDSMQCWSANEFFFENKTSIPYHSLSYEWDFSGLDSSKILSPRFSFPTHGVYTIHMRAISEKMCEDLYTKQVVVHAMPKALFSIADTAMCLRNNSFVTNNMSYIDSGSLSYSWFFNAVDSSNAVSPSFSASQAGWYSIKLYVKSENNCIDSSLQRVEVFPMPVAQFSVSDSTLCQSGSQFDFVNSTQIQNGNIASHEWQMGDGTTLFSFVPSYIYSNYGEYTVQLISTSDRGCSDSFAKMLGVYENPSADFVVDTVCLHTENTFIAMPYSKDGAIQTYTWLLGDGSIYSDSSFGHVFQSPGEYSTSLVVSSLYGCTDTMSKNAIAKVHPLPMVDFSFEKTMDSLQYTEFQFYDSTKGTKPFNYSWELGEGILSSMQNPKVLYSDTGYQWISLTVIDSNNCANTIEKEIYRLPKNTAFVPSAFSPNSDEHNGLFKVQGVAYARNFKMEIYSRWGELIFETTDLHQAWDGSFKGKPVAEGVYLYKITYAGLHKELVRSFGTDTLLR